MKGVIPMCLSKMVIEKYGKEKWEEALDLAGLPKYTSFLAAQNIEDASVLKVVDAVCKVLKITMQQAADAFGDYWVNKFASKVYKAYFMNHENAKAFLLKMNDIHRSTTSAMAGAKPPQFVFEDIGPNKLVMTYISDRGLMDFFIGLLKGVGQYFNETLHIRRLSNNKVDITFA